MLPDKLREISTNKTVDAFHLYLFSLDLQYMYKKFANSVTLAELGWGCCGSKIKAVKLHGTYYKFDDNPKFI